jgi:putative ABC transport system permease protein
LAHRQPPLPSPRWKKARGDLLAQKGRTLLVVAAIVVGLAGAGTILNAWALVRVTTVDGYLSSDPPLATLHVDSVTPSLLEVVRAVPGVRDAEGRRTTMARAQVGAASFTAMLFTAEDLGAVRVGRLQDGAGKWPPPRGTLAIERSSVDFSGVAVDDDVLLTFGDRAPLTVRVSGLARDVGLAPGWMEHLLYGFISRATLDSLGASSVLNELRIVATDASLDRDAARRLAYRVRDAVQAAGQRVRDVEVPEPGQHLHAPQMDSLLYTQGAFALMALLLSAFLVVNLVNAMLTGQVREIGVMKAIGARWPQLAAMYLAVAAALGALAVVIALPVALVAGRRYAALKAELLNFDIEGHAIPAWVIALQVVAGILLPVLAAALPVWRGCRIGVNDALRDVGIPPTRSLDGVLLRIRGLPRPLLFSLRNAFRRRQRTALTVLALASGGAVFLGALNLRQAVLGATALNFSAYRHHFTLRLAAPQDPDSVETAIRGIAGVEVVEAWAGARASIDHGDGMPGNTFVVTGPPANTRLLSPRLLAGRWLAAGDSGVIVVNRALLRDESTLVEGMRIKLLIAGAITEWTIVGIVDLGTGAAAYAPRQNVAALLAEGRIGTVAVRSALAGQASQVELIQRLRRDLTDRGMLVSSSTLLEEARRSTEDHLIMVIDFLGAMSWLVVLVGGLGLASTMGLAVLERTREIGVLRAIGARHGAIFSLVQAEGLTVAWLSWAVAIPLSIPMSVLLGNAFGRIMLRVPVSWWPDWRATLSWFGLVTVVSVVACAWPARRAMRVPTASALTYE